MKLSNQFNDTKASLDALSATIQTYITKLERAEPALAQEFKDLKEITNTASTYIANFVAKHGS